jgi:hypothetical protein
MFEEIFPHREQQVPMDSYAQDTHLASLSPTSVITSLKVIFSGNNSLMQQFSTEAEFFS